MTPKEILSKIADGTIKVGSVEECAKSDVHLCSSTPTGLKNEQQGVCSECGKPVWFTNVFPGDKVPRKICVTCALTIARGEQEFSA